MVLHNVLVGYRVPTVVHVIFRSSQWMLRESSLPAVRWQSLGVKAGVAFLLVASDIHQVIATAPVCTD